MSRCYNNLVSCQKYCECLYDYTTNRFCCDTTKNRSAWSIIKANMLWIIIIVLYVLISCPCRRRRVRQDDNAQNDQQQPPMVDNEQNTGLIPDQIQPAHQG